MNDFSMKHDDFVFSQENINKQKWKNHDMLCTEGSESIKTSNSYLLQFSPPEYAINI